MNRAGYDDCIDDNWALIKWRGQVASATRGKRGQQFFRDLIAALDAMEVKELAYMNVASEDGPVCAMGAVARARGVDLSEEQRQLDEEDDDPEWTTCVVGSKLDIAGPLAREVAFVNDELGRHDETPAVRWHRMRRWAEGQLND